MLLSQTWKRFSLLVSSAIIRRVPAWSKPLSLLCLSLGVGVTLVGAKNLGWLEASELAVYDQMLRVRPALPDDERLLVLAITEADIEAYNNDDYPILDSVIYKLLTKLEQYEPLAIGLDNYRHTPTQKGEQGQKEFAQLLDLLQNSDRIIPVCKLPDQEDPTGKASPPGIEPNQVGFADLVVDSGGILRRGLLIVDQISPDSSCQTQWSLSFQLALRYLETQTELQQSTREKQELPADAEDRPFYLGKAVFRRLLTNSGGYQGVENKGYQILLNYRSDGAGAPMLSLKDIFEDNFDPALITNKVILVGVTAESSKDLFYTPYSAGKNDNQKMPGVVVHAHLTSQIISAALAERPLFWFASEWGENFWILLWAGAGGVVALIFSHPLRLVLSEGVALGGLLFISWVAFVNNGWLPVVAPTLALIASSATFVVSTAYQSNRERQEMAQLVEQQDRDLERLQELIKQPSPSINDATTVAWHTAQTELPPDAEDEEETAIAPPGQAWKPSLSQLGERYKIIQVLGAGGFGSTYLVEDTKSPGSPQCVIKRLQSASSDQRFLQVARRLFKTEVEILGKLGHHPQIPRLLSSFEENGEFYLVEEFIPGDLLAQELRQVQRLGEQQVVELLKDILSTLVYIHDHLVIHRDIKPSNLIRSYHNGRFVLIDFGAVKQIQPQDQAGEEKKTVAIGTKGYAPPEQYAGQPHFSSDIYALGMIGVQALSGVSPHQLEIDNENGEFQLKSHLEGVKPQLIAILNKMVRYHFRDRYQSAKAVLEDLKRL